MNFNTNSKIEIISAAENGNLQVDFYDKTTEECESIEVDKEQFESWLLANECVEKKRNEDSQFAAFEDYYGNQSHYIDMYDYLIEQSKESNVFNHISKSINHILTA